MAHGDALLRDVGISGQLLAEWALTPKQLSLLKAAIVRINDANGPWIGEGDGEFFPRPLLQSRFNTVLLRMALDAWLRHLPYSPGNAWQEGFCAFDEASAFKKAAWFWICLAWCEPFESDEVPEPLLLEVFPAIAPAKLAQLQFGFAVCAGWLEEPFDVLPGRKTSGQLACTSADWQELMQRTIEVFPSHRHTPDKRQLAELFLYISNRFQAWVMNANPDIQYECTRS